MRWVAGELEAFQDTLKTTGGLTALKNTHDRCECVLIPVPIDLLLWESNEITRILPCTDVQITVWPVKPLFLSLCLSLVYFLYLTGMFWHDFQTVTLGFTRQSGCQNLKTSWSCQSWEYECGDMEQQVLAALTDWAMIKEVW